MGQWLTFVNDAFNRSMQVIHVNNRPKPMQFLLTHEFCFRRFDWFEVGIHPSVDQFT